MKYILLTLLLSCSAIEELQVYNEPCEVISRSYEWRVTGDKMIVRFKSKERKGMLFWMEINERDSNFYYPGKPVLITLNR